jgi:hypothetical protein
MARSTSNPATCECGLDFVVGIPEDEAAHDKWHGEYALGPDVPEVMSLRCLASKDSLRLVLADKSDKKPIRKAVAYVAMVAHRCMQEYKAGYYGGDSEENCRLYALIEGTRMVGMVISSIDASFRHYSWNSEGEYQVSDSNVIVHSGPKIVRVWIAASYRRGGLAKWLIDEVGKDLNCDVPNLGWEMPLTDSGNLLVKALCADGFLGCGDVYSHYNRK